MAKKADCISEPDYSIESSLCMKYSKYVRVRIFLMVVTLFATYLTKSLNVCLRYINPSHLEDLSFLGSMGETENERYLTGEMFNHVCRLFAILCGWGYFEGSADDLWAHLYDYFKGDLRCMPPTEDTLMQRVLRAFKQSPSANLPFYSSKISQTTYSSLQCCLSVQSQQ